MTKTNIFTKTLVISAFLALSACAGGKDDLSSTEILPDDTSQEQTFNEAEQNETDVRDMVEVEAAATSTSERDAILRNYDHLDPNRVVASKALAEAVVYFHQNKAKIRNKKYVSILDFSKSSKEKRFHIIDMDTGKVWSIHVAHGKGSDSNHDGYAEKFSNKSGSKASSLGFYLTGSTYSGSNGLSLKLDGLSSTNSNARGRAVVIHGANYVREKEVIQGRSWGCPAVAMELRTQVINMLKNGSLIYAISR